MKLSFIIICILIVLLPNIGCWQRLCSEQQTLCTLGVCDVPDCSICGPSSSVCHTVNPLQPIPQKLPGTTQNILIYYNGPPVRLDSSSLDRYNRLRNVTLYGNFASLASETFGNHKDLKVLILRHTLISIFPRDLFHPSSRLTRLIVSHNKFTLIPVNIFHAIKHVWYIDLSYNPINICVAESIGDHFSQLPHLRYVSLAGLGAHNNQSCTLGSDFLMPLAQVETLDLSQSDIVHYNHSMLEKLYGMKTLVLNNLEPYNSCPALVNGLFMHLPPNLLTIRAEGWKTSRSLSAHCYLNETSFDPFRGTKLHELRLGYSDRILGDRLSSSLFEGIKLTMLDLTWCRISHIDDDAFDNLPHLGFLSLEGNQLGPRQLKLFNSQASGLRIKQLTLESVGSFSDGQLVYQLGHILENCPNMKGLLMNGNFMVKLPIFSSMDTGTDLFNYKAFNIVQLGFDDNRLTDLSRSATQEMCYLMPNLTHFWAQNNLINDITGLCSSIRHLVLADNLIGSNEAMNLESLKSLVLLTRLDLARNRIRTLPHDLVHGMPTFTAFFMPGNEIRHMPTDFFKNNPYLSHIDLSNNLLTSIDWGMFAYSDWFYVIYLQDNLITKIPENITSRLDKLAEKKLKPFWMFDILGNPFDCSCGNIHLQKWVRTSKFVADVKNLTCSGFDDHRVGNLVYNYTESDFVCTWQRFTYIGCSVIVAIALSVPLGICAYKNRWYISHIRVVAKAMLTRAQQIKLEQQCAYDAFISYNPCSDNDSLWIIEHLIPEIEGKDERTCSTARVANEDHKTKEAALKLYIRERDSVIGTQKYTEQCRAVQDSRKLIILLSNSYLGSPECLSEANLIAGCETDGAQCYHPDRILVLVIEELDEQIIVPPITGLLQQNVIDVVPSVRENSKKMKSVWNRIRKFVSRQNYTYKKVSKKQKQRYTRM